MDMGKRGIRNTNSPGHVLQAGLQNTKKSLGKWIPGNKQSLGIREKRLERIYKTTWRNSPTMGDRKVGKTQLLPARSFSNEKNFKRKSGAWQVKVGKKEDHIKQKHPNM